MFKFSFNTDEKTSEVKANDNKIEDIYFNNTECNDCEEVTIVEGLIEDLDVCKLNSTNLKIGNVTLVYIIPTHVLRDFQIFSNIHNAETQHTDLIPGIYEGGAKLWECTEDLLNYLQTNFTAEKWTGKDVLDLGCGCGLLGIFALNFGAKVHFQDYNKDVLEKVTIPNVLLNYHPNCFDLKKVSNNAKFFCGDWSKYVKFTKDGPHFDYILTSETIYNPQNYKKILKTFAEKLKPDGIVFVAAKTYYFGVGGSLRQFEDLIKRENLFDVKTVWSSQGGVNREIIELRRIIV